MRFVSMFVVCLIGMSAHAGYSDQLLNPLCPSIATGVPTKTQRTGFVKLSNGRQLYAEYVLPAPGKPTIVLVNGLTYRLGCWDAFVRELHGEGFGILRYDPIGHGKTLLKYSKSIGEIPHEAQADDLALLLDAFKLKTAHVVGLSYGGGIGFSFAVRHPSRLATLTAMAPFVAPIKWQDDYLNLLVSQTRLMFPLWQASDDEIYDYCLRNFVYSSYPTFEPITLENPYKLEATFRLVQGIRKFHVADVVHRIPKGKLHLVIGADDTYVPHDMHENFWKALPMGTAASRLVMLGTGHKIPELEPRFAARWVKEIVRGNAKLSLGRTFTGTPWKGVATSDSVVVDGLGGR